MSQPFSIYSWAWKPKTNLDNCTFFYFNWTKQSNKLFRSSQSFVSNLFTLITIYKIVNSISVLSNQIQYLRISEKMCGCWKLCCCSYWFWKFSIGPLFSNLFLVQQSFWQGGLLHFNYIVDICVPCPFLKVQWVSQESVIVTFPSHDHL